MANTIRLKRASGSDPGASDLVTGEIAVRTDNGKLFTKKDNGSVTEISGGGGIDDGDKGDITVSNSGDTFTIDSGVVTSAKIADDTIVNADINSSAAIAGSKISPDFGSQTVTTTGNLGGKNLNLLHTSPTISLTDSNNDDDFAITVDGGLFKIIDATNNADRLFIHSDGEIDLWGHVDIGAGLDVTGQITATSHLDMPDDAKIKLGTGDDLKLYHDGSNSFIQDSGTGNLKVLTNNLELLNAANDEYMVVATQDGAVDLYYDGGKKFETSSTGATLSGNLGIDANVFHNGDTDTMLSFSAANQADINCGGNVIGRFTTNGLALGDNKRLDILDGSGHRSGTINNADSGANSLRISADPDDSGSSTIITFHIDGSEKVRIDSSSNLYIPSDSGKLQLGASQDLQIYHDGSNSYIQDAGTGSLQVYTNGTDIRFKTNDGEVMAQMIKDGAVDLYYNASKKFETTSTGVQISHSGDPIVLVTGSGHPQLKLQTTGTTDNCSVDFGDNDGIVGRILYQNNGNEMQFYTNGLSNARLTLGSSGQIGVNNQQFGSSGQVLTSQGSGSSAIWTTVSSGIPASGGTFTGDIAISGGAAALTVNANSDIRFTNGDWTGNATKIQQHSNRLYVVGGSDGIMFREDGTDRIHIDGSGNLIPKGSYNLGSSGDRWSNVFTNDLHLSNEGGSNDVDGTYGSYTIQEGAEDLFLINRRNGKKYKFNLTEVA